MAVCPLPSVPGATPPSADSSAEGGTDLRFAPNGRERSPWLLRLDALRKHLRKSGRRFAEEDLGCSHAEWSRIWNMQRERMPDRMIDHVLALHPELHRAYARMVKDRALVRRQELLPPPQAPREGDVPPR